MHFAITIHLYMLITALMMATQMAIIMLMHWIWYRTGIICRVRQKLMNINFIIPI